MKGIILLCWDKINQKQPLPITYRILISNQHITTPKNISILASVLSHMKQEDWRRRRRRKRWDAFFTRAVHIE
jgi:hypothetical protein